MFMKGQASLFFLAVIALIIVGMAFITVSVFHINLIFQIRKNIEVITEFDDRGTELASFMGSKFSDMYLPEMLGCLSIDSSEADELKAKIRNLLERIHTTYLFDVSWPGGSLDLQRGMWIRPEKTCWVEP
ncbi:MAG: hypothetical protein DRP15_03065, partial [Candidatus Aenigmatarchaeota archaeon]